MKPKRGLAAKEDGVDAHEQMALYAKHKKIIERECDNSVSAQKLMERWKCFRLYDAIEAEASRRALREMTLGSEA